MSFWGIELKTKSRPIMGLGTAALLRLLTYSWKSLLKWLLVWALGGFALILDALIFLAEEALTRLSTRVRHIGQPVFRRSLEARPSRGLWSPPTAPFFSYKQTCRRKSTRRERLVIDKLVTDNTKVSMGGTEQTHSSVPLKHPVLFCSSLLVGSAYSVLPMFSKYG